MEQKLIYNILSGVAKNMQSINNEMIYTSTLKQATCHSALLLSQLYNYALQTE